MVKIQCLLLLILGICQGYGQTRSGRQVYKPISVSYRYVQMPAMGFIVSQVSTKRLRENKTEFVEIINIIINQDSVRKYVIDAAQQQALPIAWQGPQPQDELLVTVVILPDKATGRVKWEPVSLDSLQSQSLEPFATIAQDCFARIYTAKANPYAINLQTRYLDVKPIINRDGRLWTTRNVVLTEYFLLRNRATWFPDQGDGVTINCWAKPITRTEVAQLQRSIANTAIPATRKPSIQGELAQKYLLHGESKQLYYFWSIPPRILHGSIASYGAGDFQFKPGVGLVSGQYAAYFYPDSFGAGGNGNVPFDAIGVKILSAK